MEHTFPSNPAVSSTRVAKSLKMKFAQFSFDLMVGQRYLSGRCASFTITNTHHS